MPKNLGLYNNSLSVPRKKDIDAVVDTVEMHDSDIQQLETDVNELNTEVGAFKTALTSKQNTITGAGSTITDDNLTVNRVVVSNASGKVAISDITTTELNYLDGVTSNIQTQLNSKLSTVPVTSVNNKTGAVTLNASDVNALSINGGTVNGNIKVTGSSNSWFGIEYNGRNWYLQESGGMIGLGAGWANSLKLDPSGNMTMTGTIDMGGFKITNVATPTADTDAANKAYADAQKGVEVLTQSAQPTAQVTGDMWFQTT